MENTDNKNAEAKITPPDFTTLGILPELITNLESQKIQIPTQIQFEAISKIIDGNDLIAVAQTGSGKTLAYLLPVITKLHQNPLSRAVVLSPTRETAEQIHRVVKEISTGFKITSSIAATGAPLVQQGKELKKNPRLIVATPGRLYEHLQGNKLLLKGLDILVIDEADRILNLGFEKQLQFIQSTLRGQRQTLLFAATFSAETEPIAKIFMKPDTVMLRSSASGAPVATLQQKIFYMKAGQKENKLIDVLQKAKGGVLIFSDNQEGCVALGRLLANHAFSSEFIHGDMNPGHRNRVLREFREQKIQIIVTTDLLARGLDEPSINYVISYDLPYKAEDYLHRIGRTARAGREGKAITFVTPSDGRTFRRMKDYIANANEETITDNFKFVDR